MALRKYKKQVVPGTVRRVVPEYNPDIVRELEREARTPSPPKLTKQGVRDLNSYGAQIPKYNAAMLCNHKWECMGDYDYCKKCDMSDPCGHACASIEFHSSHQHRGV